MSLIITCPTCGQQATAPDGSGGQQVRCPHCQAVLTVPAEQPTEPEPIDELEPVPPRRSQRMSRVEWDDEEDEYDDDLELPRSRRRGSRCPYCDSREPTDSREEISQTGWILFAVLLAFCWPLCWIPLLTCKDRVRVCSECRRRR